MSRRCVGYEGEGRHRRGIYADEGPAAAGGVSGLAAIGRLSALDVRETAGTIEFGAGSVERRLMTEVEREVRQADADKASPIAPVAVARRPALGSPEHVQASRMRGAARHVEVIAARRPVPLIHLADPPVTALEEPVMPPATSQVLRELVAAANVADEAWDRFDSADTARILAEEAWLIAKRDLARAWASVRDLVDADRSVSLPTADDVRGILATEPDEAENDEAIADIPDEPADDELEVVTTRASEPPAAAAIGGKQERILAAAIRLRGDRNGIAQACNTTAANVTATLHNLGKRGRLPIDLIPLLPAGFAKYSGV